MKNSLAGQDAHVSLLDGEMINTKQPFQKREDRTPSPPRCPPVPQPSLLALETHIDIVSE